MIKKLSVLMPVYNSEEFISQAINCILIQTFNDFEFIIVNDGSTDNTEKIILSFSDPRIKYFKLPHQGISETLNFGISKASSDLIARMDADDIALAFRLEEQMNFINANPNYDVVSCWYALFKNDKIKYPVKTAEHDFEIKKRLMLHGEICHAGAIFKKNLIKKFEYRGDVFEDYDLWLRIKNEALFYNIPKVLFFPRISKKSLSRNEREKILKTIYEIQKPYYENLHQSFGIKSMQEENEFKGWREFFFGNKNEARCFWLKLNFKVLLKPKVLIAALITFFPETIFYKIKNSNLRFKFQYFFSFFSSQNIKLRNDFKKLIKSLKAVSNTHP